ncbi:MULTISPECIES: hypothetical protein [unclassified Stenotrophomonas]|uniref:hypothetical protein n=1 Tax=unclassified Stenotrophomonas TaxID=196198 RepID=UPI0025D73986|nr:MULTISPECIES: hypothetical protein [unclassified Stenotrophomonas]
MRALLSRNLGGDSSYGEALSVMRMVKGSGVLLIVGVMFAVGMPSTQAQHVFKCAGPAGPVYQSAACEGPELARWDAVPQADDPLLERRLLQIQAELERSYRRQARTVGKARRRSGPRQTLSPCERERQGRAKAYAAAGLKRSFALSSYWDNRVHQVCR